MAGSMRREGLDGGPGLEAAGVSEHGHEKREKDEEDQGRNLGRGPYGVFHLPNVIRSHTISDFEDDPDNHNFNSFRATEYNDSTYVPSSTPDDPTAGVLHDIGARFPGEILGRVLDFIQCRRKEERFQVAQMALACKEWASRCHAVAFEWVKLCSGKDVVKLLSLMESPHSHIASYIKTLWLVQKGTPTAPWIHLVTLRLVPKLSLNPHRSIELELDLDLDDTASGCFRSIYDGLPRVHSSFSTSPISRLFIQNASFESFADLAHLVDEIPSLRFLYLDKLTWPSNSDVPETQPVLLPRRRTVPPFLNCIHLSNCTDIVSGIDLLIGKRRKARGETTPFDLDLNHEQQHFIKNMSLIAMNGLDRFGSAVKLTIDPAHGECRGGDQRPVYIHNPDMSRCQILASSAAYTLVNAAFVITALTEDSPLAKIKTIKTITIHTERKDRSREVVLWVLILYEYLIPIQELIVGFEDSFHEVLRDENDELRYLRSVGRLKYKFVKKTRNGRYRKVFIIRRFVPNFPSLMHPLKFPAMRPSRRRRTRTRISF
ncbi:hypothetical protein PHLCEN_2v2955 [Hermanssonia centrifuga]|uniref:Uncharacterized protein n=1 Tax=Hermanssonia centrifuga TaxID=98765 RepID=A0A2R6RHP9_9APHY|nr:hypothetical protein PHLCEN_2v2955 [Hermanssonia centrifuga]